MSLPCGKQSRVCPTKDWGGTIMIHEGVLVPCSSLQQTILALIFRQHTHKRQSPTHCRPRQQQQQHKNNNNSTHTACITSHSPPLPGCACLPTTNPCPTSRGASHGRLKHHHHTHQPWQSQLPIHTWPMLRVGVLPSHARARAPQPAHHPHCTQAHTHRC